MDPRQSLQRSNHPYHYPSQQQMSQYGQHRQIQQHTGESNGHNDYTPVLQPINTHQGTYPQGDQIRSASSTTSYQPLASIPISPGFGMYAHGTYMPGPERQSIPQPPPSPSQSDCQEEEEYRSRIFAPPPEMHEFQGKKYGLRILQEPIRARMCGFGDKVSKENECLCFL